MAIIGQGLVLMVAGMGIVYLFLTVLIFVAKYSSAFVAKFDHIIPQEAPKKAPKKVATDDDANIALAIAVALG
ncbi:MAG: OadG family protein [Kiritimatiellae bacterium]|nr:OadG family protein [Kiritimatiellia bacterium]